jgi:hypothetical protein
MKLETILIRTGACLNARIWAKTQPDLETAWRECKRSDWMLWLFARTTLTQDDPRLRLMACDFAEASLVYVPAGEDRPRRAIEVARRFAAGDATREELSAARAAAGAAAGAAAWAAAGAAAEDAAEDAAWAAARAAAEDAAWAAAGAAAGDAARAAAGAAAWDAQSDIIRRYFPECPEIAVNALRPGCLSR